MKKAVYILAVIVFLAFARGVFADSISEKNSFFVDSGYDAEGREKIEAVLIKVTPKAYFYVDSNWWAKEAVQEDVYESLSVLEGEFESNIYPRLASVFGREASPGIDKDTRITILLHPIRENAGGYFRSNDGYLKVQIPNSNQREMIYLNANRITDKLAKSLLAHELVHLITFNQKENAYNVSEEVWLNELRAEYVPTLLGYNEEYKGSYLEKRADFFLKDPTDSLTDWTGAEKDYGSISLFGHYLVDHYGIEILSDSLKSDKTGIDSINYALAKNGYEETFSDIFVDWTIAVLVNNCTYGEKYCYLSENLKDFQVGGRINFLPVSGESSLSFSNFTKMWRGNWYKIIGGNNDLKVSFDVRSGVGFKVTYLTQNLSRDYEVNFLEIDEYGKGEATIKGFGGNIISLFLIPVVVGENNSNVSSFYPFSWEVSVKSDQNNTELIQQLLAKIEYLKNEINKVQGRITAILAGRRNSSLSPTPASNSCSITTNLSYGTSNRQVTCLQEFLKSQGPQIYPEGLVTGFFGNLTRQAVIRFQEKYSSEILVPWGLSSGTGFVGSTTIDKIKELLTK